MMAKYTFVRLRSEGLVWREVGGEVMVLDVATSRSLTVNCEGAALWPLLVRGTRRAELGAALARRFGIDEGQASADVEAFLSELVALGMVQDGGDMAAAFPGAAPGPTGGNGTTSTTGTTASPAE